MTRRIPATQLAAERNTATVRLACLNGENRMTRILFVGQKPETVDFSDPALPPGFDADKINAGIAVAVAKIEERG
jgi:hypothetical protein